MWFTSIKDEKCSLSAKVLFMNYFPWAGENEVSQNGVVKKKNPNQVASYIMKIICMKT